MPMETQALLTKNLKKLRKAKGLTQDDLAEKSGFSSGFIKQVETGRSWVSPDAVDKICEALDLTPAELFHDPDHDQKIIKVVPVSIALKKMGSIPDHIYDLAEKYDPNHKVWKDIQRAFELFEMVEEEKADKTKKA